LWNSKVERVVSGVVRGGFEGEPESRVACVEAERVFGFGRGAEGGMKTTREVVEQRRKRKKRGMRRRNIIEERVSIEPILVICQMEGLKSWAWVVCTEILPAC
jgi:hypothetical protein